MIQRLRSTWSRNRGLALTVAAGAFWWLAMYLGILMRHR